LQVAVVGNPDVVMPNVTLFDIFTHDFWGNDILRRRPGGWTHDSWRPLVTLSFRLNFLMGGHKPTVFHITNVLLHAVCASLAYLFARQIAYAAWAPPRSSREGEPSNGPRTAPDTFAAVAGLLFALHPIHSECVANVTSRADTMAAIFGFLSCTAFIWGRHGSDAGARARGCCASFARDALQWLAAILLMLAGLLCKETILTLPAVLAVIDVLLAVPQLLIDLGRGETTAIAAAEKVTGEGAAASEETANDSDAATSTATRAGRIECCTMLARVFRSALRTLPIIRALVTVAFGAGLYWLRIEVMSKGYSLQSFANELHNPLAIIEPATARLIAKAFVQAWSVADLLLPVFLSHEHNAHRPVVAIDDYRNTLTVAVAGGIVIAVTMSLSSLLKSIWSSISEPVATPSSAEGRVPPATVYRAVRVLLALAWIIICYAPSSHAFLYVAFVVAERTLFMTSFGGALLLAELLALNEEASSASAAETAAATAQAAAAKPAHIASRVKQGALIALCCYYAVRLWVRNGAWSNEEALLMSNLALYPHENGMSMYGLGAIRMHQSKWEEAEKYFLRATEETTLAEPHILLSQIYWRVFKNAESAISQLEKIEKTSSPRKEVLQNLGMLLISTGRAPAWNETAKQRAEYNILVGHKAHGYPMAHPNIGLLANNAACTRLLSEPYRYGNYELAVEHADEAVTFRHTSRVTAFKNSAMMRAIQGDARGALDALAAGVAYIRELASNPDVRENEVAQREAVELTRSFEIIETAIRVNMPTILDWEEQTHQTSPPTYTVGAAADARLQLLGGECAMELLVW
jgi:tetratricopeptide (TPR) repeat protein